MLKRLLFLLSCSVLLPLVEYNCTAETIASLSRDSVIVVLPFPPFNPKPPKAPINIPISASYESSINSVVLYFACNLGEIGVEVLNTKTGYYESYFVDTQTLSSVIPITGGRGHYIVLLTLSSGQQYQCELDVVSREYSLEYIDDLIVLTNK